MLVNFDEMKEVTIPHLNNGDGAVSAKMYMDSANKIMLSRIPVGASIGMHEHKTSAEINYVLSGEGEAICDGAEEELRAGRVHYCPKGSSHSIVNTGDGELALFTVVPEQ